MTHAKFMDATKALEEARKAQEMARAIWLLARVAHPMALDITAAENYCEASNAVADAESRFDEAQMEAQAEYFNTEFGRQESA